jgi:hypothetical protein
MANATTNELFILKWMKIYVAGRLLFIAERMLWLGSACNKLAKALLARNQRSWQLFAATLLHGTPSIRPSLAAAAAASTVAPSSANFASSAGSSPQRA